MVVFNSESLSFTLEIEKNIPTIYLANMHDLAEYVLFKENIELELQKIHPPIEPISEFVGAVHGNYVGFLYRESRDRATGILGELTS